MSRRAEQQRRRLNAYRRARYQRDRLTRAQRQQIEACDFLHPANRLPANPLPLIGR